MSGPFFAFGAFDEEIERKLEAITVPASALAASLLDRAPGLRPVWRQLETLSFDHVYPNYLNHTVRVAASLLSARPGASDGELALALCHNAREVGVLDALQLPREVTAAIDVLTIDRRRERDDGYLTAFYEGIERAGLIVLKALDKLDNALEWVRYDLDPWHGRVVLDHVCPRVEAENPRLAGYLRELIPYVLGPDAKARFALAS